MPELDPRKVLDLLDDNSDWNNSDEDEMSDSDEENGGRVFVNYIEQYEVLLSRFYR